MQRALLDTNIYGLIAKDDRRLEVVGSIKSDKNLVIYGFKVIRNELRDIPKKIKMGGRNIRIDFGGSKSKDNIINDFQIVSCGSINNLNIIVSNDEKSMYTENAIRAYKLVNSVLGMKLPEFIDYTKFKRNLRGESNELF